MAEMKWTEEQQQVIDLRDCSMLVSAAAGSGKTAVLVERILTMVTDPVHPIDIDRLLVVTFTKAAASEMRERIRIALEKRLQETPEEDALYSHLLKQTTLVHNAQITTIDSFCLNIIRNHFHTIDLEPGFRIADEGELKLLREDICDQVLNVFYEEKDPKFMHFVDSYSTAKSDDRIRDMMLTLYDYAQSSPWPDEWLNQCKEAYQATKSSDFEKKDWVQGFLSYIRVRLSDMAEEYHKIHQYTLDEDGPQVYEGNIFSEYTQIASASRETSYEELKEAIAHIRFDRLPAARKYTGSEEKKDAVTETRKSVKESIQKMQKDYFSISLDEQYEVLLKTGQMAEVLITLTKAFTEAFRAEKERINVQDFSDIEHNALRVLRQTELPHETTAVAAEYREQFVEVMIDEYQDSNYLQEEILSAICGHDGKQNMFMVGDVKQSIYRFRLARPELFTGKYKAFSDDVTAATRRIDLHKNFRSRSEVVSVVNDVFQSIMAADLGGVEYDQDAQLYFGANYYEDYEKGDVCQAEVILVPDDGVEDKKSREARAVAYRIRQMIEEEEFPVSEKHPKKEYRDIVILLRSLSGWADVFQKVFDEEGIPLIVSSRTGYFSAREVQAILSMLRLLDNAKQDIPLASVMKSEMGDFTATELAMIKAAFPKKAFYESVWMYPQYEKADADLAQKIQDFGTMIDDFRSRIADVPIHQLIQQILNETGYRNLVAAMPGGEKRRANLDMLVEKAIAYENTSYHGLFHFIRYMDQLIQYNQDYGEAEVVSEQENAVRLMTTHSSKGLEFPIVFVCGMGKQFNESDSRSACIFHPSYGIGMKLYDSETRKKTETLIHQVLALETKKENLGEELRVLYVALTRAKEKLIMTGYTKADLNLAPADWHGIKKVMSFTERMGARCYLDWVVPALIDNRYQIQVWNFEDMVTHEVKKQSRLIEKRTQVLAAVADYREDLYQDIEKRLSWTYPHAEDYLPKQKISVSELKHKAIEAQIEDEDIVPRIFEHEENVPYVPQFIEAAEENVGALKGTATHRILECYSFAQLPEFANMKEAVSHVKAFLSQLVERERMTQEAADLVNCYQVALFLNSETGKQMQAAAKAGFLKKEQPFVMALSAQEAWEDSKSKESVLIQGIIDVFWQDEEGITLLDYKTDRVTSEQELVDRYRKQLVLYAQALNRNFDPIEVKHILIYSFCLEKVIEIDWSI